MTRVILNVWNDVSKNVVRVNNSANKGQKYKVSEKVLKVDVRAWKKFGIQVEMFANKTIQSNAMDKRPAFTIKDLKMKKHIANLWK